MKLPTTLWITSNKWLPYQPKEKNIQLFETQKPSDAVVKYITHDEDMTHTQYYTYPPLKENHELYYEITNI